MNGAQRLYCPHCGAPVEKGAAFCGACGGRVASLARGGLSGRRRAVYLVVVLLAGAVFTGALYSLGASASTDAQGFVAYSDPQAAVSFQHPAGWSAVQNGSTVAEFVGENGTVTLQLFDNGGAGQSAPALINETFAELGAKGNNAETTLPLDLGVSGETISEIGVQVGARDSLVTFFSSSGEDYTLVCGTASALYFQTLATCESISSTLVIRP